MFLHNRSTSISIGTEITVESIRYLGMSITGTASTFTLVFEASFNGIDYFPVMGRCADDTTITFITETSTINKIVLFDVTTYNKFRARITAINDGYLTVESNEER